MQFALVQSGKIKRIVSSSDKPAGFIKLPKGHEVIVGDEVAFFDEGYRRKSVERCRDEGLLEYDEEEHINVRWHGGRWDVRADYTKERYWDKNTGEPVRFKLGEKPQSCHTNVVKSDGEALWSEKDGWYVPQKVLDRRRVEAIEEELRQKDLASVRALRASTLGTASAEDMSRLADIESEAESLRAEKAALGADVAEEG